MTNREDIDDILKNALIEAGLEYYMHSRHGFEKGEMKKIFDDIIKECKTRLSKKGVVIGYTSPKDCGWETWVCLDERMCAPLIEEE